VEPLASDVSVIPSAKYLRKSRDEVTDRSPPDPARTGRLESSLATLAPEQPAVERFG
jgi:hypothetical protein